MDIKDTKEITAEMAVHLKRNIVDMEPLGVGYQIACYDMVLALVNGNPYVDRYMCRDAAYHLASHAGFILGAEYDCMVEGLVEGVKVPTDMTSYLIGELDRVYVTRLARRCGLADSPLESAIVFGLMAIGAVNELLMPAGFSKHIAQQFPIGSYRADFAIPNKRIVIETDGHTYHEKTVEQAVSDRTRDRFMVNEGWKVYRYHRAEIESDLQKVAHEVHKMTRFDD